MLSDKMIILITKDKMFILAISDDSPIMCSNALYLSMREGHQ